MGCKLLDLWKELFEEKLSIKDKGQVHVQDV
jgi:hypothetical protein